MKDIRVRHSKSNVAWNVVAMELGMKFKLAQIPYAIGDSDTLSMRNRVEASDDARFIASCFINREHVNNLILDVVNKNK